MYRASNYCPGAESSRPVDGPTNTAVNSILASGGPPDPDVPRGFRDPCSGVDISAQGPRGNTRIGVRITPDSSSRMISSDPGFSRF